jgi:indolepyruvate ferredoxin oxidoreductase alpha subunit
MLGASINYPMRGCVTWKSIVGTNVAADALSNLASPGVIGGALIVVGEDYGEGASIIQERTQAYALKSSVWLMDPRPSLPAIVRCTEKAFELSEATNTPVMMELRIRACHVTGEFVAKDNKAPTVSRNQPLANPAVHNYDRISHPPSTYVHEKVKVEVRQPAAERFIVENGLNEFFPGERSDLGIIVQGGITNVLVRGLDRLEVEGKVPTLVLNVTHPLVPDQIADFCKGKRAVLIVEEGAPDYIEQSIHALLRKRDIDTKIYGKDVLPMAGEYTAEVLTDGLLKFFARAANDIDLDGPRRGAEDPGRPAAAAAARLLRRLPRTAGLLGDQAARARGRQGPYLERHRLPLVRDPGAVQPRQFDPGLRHVTCRGGRGGARDAETHHFGDGRRRLLAQRPAVGRGLIDVQ